MWVGGQRHASAALPPEKIRCPLYRRLDGPRSWSVRVWKISPQPGFDPLTVQPVTSRYTVWANPTPYTYINACNSVITYISSPIYKELLKEAEGGNNKWPWNVRLSLSMFVHLG